jgi:RNA recognition motif-containing protein
MSGRYRDWSLDCKVYVGNLQENAIKSDVENAFGKYGPLKNVWVARNPPGFAFVEFEDARDAEDAVRGLDGTRIGGSRVRVEMSHGRTRRGGHGGGGGGSRRFGRDGGGGRDGRHGGSRREYPRGRRSRSLSRSRSRSRF